MDPQEIDSFPVDVIRRLKHYVYRLIDPRNGETFYVGKGQGNRVFSHVREEEMLEGDWEDNKLKRIKEIRLAGFKAAHVIHRHGMDSRLAFEVEAALIDAYPGLTNGVGGIGSHDFGSMHAAEIVRRYAAKPADLDHTKAMLIIINRTAAEATSFYEATRYAWKINRSRAEEADVILATVQGEIVEAFVANSWLEATAENFPGHEPIPGRFGFVGQEAPDSVRKNFVHRRVPDKFRKRGAAAPVKYTW